MNNSVNWLLVGAGDIAKKRVASALKEVDGSRLYSVCDKDKKRAYELASYYNVEKIYDDYQDALNDSVVDAVYLAVPVSLHVPMSISAIKAGKHVLVEKPLGLNFDEVQKVLDFESSSNVTCACAYYRRFSPHYKILKEIIQKEELGKIVLIRMAYYSWFDPDSNDHKYWRTINSNSGGGPIADMGAHMFDVLIGLFGLPRSIYAKVKTLDRNWDVEDSSAMCMNMTDGALVTASFNWNSKTWGHMFEVIGTEAKVLWQPYDGIKIFKTVGKDTIELDTPLPKNIHMPLVEDFVSAILHGHKPEITFSEAAKTNRLIDAIYRSSREEKEVEV